MRIHDVSHIGPPMLPVYELETASPSVKADTRANGPGMVRQQLPILWAWLGDRVARIPPPTITLVAYSGGIALTWIGHEGRDEPEDPAHEDPAFVLDLVGNEQPLTLDRFPLSRNGRDRKTLDLSAFDRHMPWLQAHESAVGMLHPAFDQWICIGHAGWNEHGVWEVTFDADS